MTSKAICWVWSQLSRGRKLPGNQQLFQFLQYKLSLGWTFEFDICAHLLHVKSHLWPLHRLNLSLVDYSEGFLKHNSLQRVGNSVTATSGKVTCQTSIHLLIWRILPSFLRTVKTSLAKSQVSNQENCTPKALQSCYKAAEYIFLFKFLERFG